MKLDDNTFAFTAWLMRNTHVVSVTGLSIDDGYEWYNQMWGKWLENSDAGRKITNSMKMYSHVLFNRLLDENEYNNLPDSEKQQYEFYGTVTHNNDGGEEMRVDMSRGIYNPDNNVTTDKNKTITGQNNTGMYPEPGQTWLHYKGGKYEIVAMCNHTETNEVLVIYRSLSFGGFHARPYSEWHDEIWEGYHRKARFTIIGY